MNQGFGANTIIPNKELNVKITTAQNFKAIAFCLYENNKIKNSSDLIYCDQKENSEQTICLTENTLISNFNIKLDKICLIKKIVLAVVCKKNHNVSSLQNANVQISDHQNNFTYEVDLCNRYESALILGEFYQYNENWKFKFIPQGFNEGFIPLAKYYGLEISSNNTIYHQIYNENASLTRSLTESTIKTPDNLNNISNFSNNNTFTGKLTMATIFDKLKTVISSASTELTTQVGRFKNRKFMESTVAVCAIIAMASNGASSEEKRKMIDFIKQSNELSVFNTDEIIQFFNKLASSFEFDSDIGKGEAMKYITPIKTQPEAAQLSLRVGIAVAKSDGDFDPQERALAKEICLALNLNPSDFLL